MTINPYLRAAKKFEELKEKSLKALEKRHHESPQMERARDEQGRFIADDPNTPENEAWVSSKSE